MDQYNNIIHSKMLKLDNSLLELNNEIFTATKYLLQLKENSNAIVRNLSGIHTPAEYLQEFLKVNSFLLKSLSFLTEINCKFEMFNISEKWVNENDSSSKALSSSVVSEVFEDLEENFNYNSAKDAKSDGSDNSEAVDLDSFKTNKSKKKKFKKYQSKKHEKKCINSNGLKVSPNSNDNSSNNSVDISNFSNSSCDSPTLQEIVKSGSVTESESPILFDDKDDSQVVAPSEMNDTNGRVHLNTKLSSSEVQLLNCSFGHTRETVKQAATLDDVSNLLIDKSINLTASDINSNKRTNSLCHIPVPKAEVIEVKDCWYDSEVSKNFNSTKKLEGSVKQSQYTKKVNRGNDTNDDKPPVLMGNVGEEHNVNIEYIKSPSEFYVSIIDNQSNLFHELEKKLKLIPVNNVNCHNSKNNSTKASLSSEIGSYALVYSKCDEIWCRAKITNWGLNFNDDLVRVFLLDYGESKCVSFKDLQPMPEDLKKYPALAVRCHLHDVFPVDFDFKNEILLWEKESSEKMKSLTENSKNVKIKVAPDDSFHPIISLPVTVWLDDNIKCLNDLLVDTKYAVHGSDFKESAMNTEVTEKVENESMNNWNPMKEDFDSYKNSYDLDIKDPASIIYGYVGKDYERICKHFANTGYCFKGPSCRKEHQKMNPLGFTTDQEEIYKHAFKELVIPTGKTILKVQVTCILGFNKFFCLLKNQYWSSADENLQTLFNFMNQSDNVRDMKKLLIPPSAGQIVIARYSEDKAWYRARIVESQPENDQYTVEFVDYGNKEMMPLIHIRAIEARYLHLPFQAVQCSIFGIDRNPKKPPNEVLDYLKQKLDDDQISIEVISKLPGEHVNLLVHVFDREKVNIGDDLVAKEYAVLKKEIVINSASESLPG